MKRMIKAALVLSAVLLVLLFSYGVATWQAAYKARHDGRAQLLPTPSPYPRLEEKEAAKRITELFETNGDCRFPCWWGITPGRTSWQEANAILAPLVPNSLERYLADDGVMFHFEGRYGNQRFYTQVLIGIGDDAKSTEYTPVEAVLTSGVQPEYLSNLTLSKIFQSYGMPDRIYVRNPFRVNSSGLDNFEIYIHYPSKGLLVRYVYEGYVPFLPVRVCGLDQPVFADFYVGEPFVLLDFEEISGYADWEWNEEGVQWLEGATDWTVESFYKTITSAGGQTTCIVSQPPR